MVKRLRNLYLPDKIRSVIVVTKGDKAMQDKKKNLIYLLFPFLICGSVGTIILAIIVDIVLQGNIANSRYEQIYDDMIKNEALLNNVEYHGNPGELIRKLQEYSGNNLYNNYFFLIKD